MSGYTPTINKTTDGTPTRNDCDGTAEVEEVDRTKMIQRRIRHGGQWEQNTGKSQSFISTVNIDVILWLGLRVVSRYWRNQFSYQMNGSEDL